MEKEKNTKVYVLVQSGPQENQLPLVFLNKENAINAFQRLYARLCKYNIKYITWCDYEFEELHFIMEYDDKTYDEVNIFEVEVDAIDINLYPELEKE